MVTNRKWNQPVLLIFTCLALSGCGSGKAALIPVRGTVLVNGRPAARVAITMHHVDKTLTANNAHPCAATDGNGQFQLSTNRDGDGVMAGEYDVYFVWWSDPDPDRAKDLLSAAYSESRPSQFKVKIDATTSELPPFKLQADPTMEKKFVQ